MSRDVRDVVGRPGTSPLLLDEVEAVTAYESTDTFTIDAIDELATCAAIALPTSLLDAVRDWYRGTPAYDTVIEDIREGNRELA